MTSLRLLVYLCADCYRIVDVLLLTFFYCFVHCSFAPMCSEALREYSFAFFAVFLFFCFLFVVNFSFFIYSAFLVE